ncbi:hypothetical protein BDZ91DRAFT_726741, partial [Kalaharituber pfeilii]
MTLHYDSDSTNSIVIPNTIYSSQVYEWGYSHMETELHLKIRIGKKEGKSRSSGSGYLLFLFLFLFIYLFIFFWPPTRSMYSGKTAYNV